MLQPYKIRLCDEDRAELGLAEEWLPLHAELFVNVRASELADWERQTGVSIAALISGTVNPIAIDTMRAAAWYAYKLAGYSGKYEQFDPHVLKGEAADLDLSPGAADVDPPASSSADSSSAEDPAQPPARTGARRRRDAR